MLFSFSTLITEISVSQKLKEDQMFPSGEISKKEKGMCVLKRIPWSECSKLQKP